MLKKITTLTLTMFLLITFNSVLVAQKTEKAIDKEARILNELAIKFKGQPSITEDEIKKYIKLIPKFAQSGITEESLQNVSKANKIDPTRLEYMVVKISLAIQINRDVEEWKDKKNTLPEVLKPNKEEMALVAKYADDIRNAYE